MTDPCSSRVPLWTGPAALAAALLLIATCAPEPARAQEPELLPAEAAQLDLMARVSAWGRLCRPALQLDGIQRMSDDTVAVARTIDARLGDQRAANITREIVLEEQARRAQHRGFTAPATCQRLISDLQARGYLDAR